MTRVFFSRRAEDNLFQIGAYIALHDEERALSVVEELRIAALHRGLFPHSGRHRPDVREGLYTFPYGRYLLVYAVEADRVLILRVVHGARDTDAITGSQSLPPLFNTPPPA